MHLSNSYFRCNKSYKTCPVKGTITISFLFEKELFLKFVTLKTEITPWVRLDLARLGLVRLGYIWLG